MGSLHKLSVKTRSSSPTTRVRTVRTTRRARQIRVPKTLPTRLPRSAKRDTPKICVRTKLRTSRVLTLLPLRVRSKPPRRGTPARLLRDPRARRTPNGNPCTLQVTQSRYVTVRTPTTPIARHALGLWKTSTLIWSVARPSPQPMGPKNPIQSTTSPPSRPVQSARPITPRKTPRKRLSMPVVLRKAGFILKGATLSPIKRNAAATTLLKFLASLPRALGNPMRCIKTGVRFATYLKCTSFLRRTAQKRVT